jgi:poly-gamma-glutamate capsule biosynthesis protein CapA/YwtB (metallophosphatase superfamily)
VDDDVVTLSLCGDVMTGRGVDQILPCPGDPQLREAYAPDARAYVALAEAASGPVPHPVEFTWPWGEALPLLAGLAPDVRLINLETSITRSGDFAPGKAVHYRMNPANVACLTVAQPDVCVLANNHVLDFGRTGLAETLDTLAGAGLQAAGAGRDTAAAQRPAVACLPDGGRVLVLACGDRSSGIPPGWAAGPSLPGVDLLPGLSAPAAGQVASRVRARRRPGDIAVVSIHWGSNWGYEVGQDQVEFAHRLIDGGVDLVHGHSSHHPRPVEVYRGKLILYGCGDFIDDYEGIAGYEEYRDDLRLLYLASLRRGTGELAGLRMVPMHASRMRLEPASAVDARWLAAVLDRVSRPFGSRVELAPGGALVLRPGTPSAGAPAPRRPG